MTTISRILRRAAPVLCLALAACGGDGSPAAPAAPESPAPRQETVFDDLVDKKQELPATVEATQQQHVDDTRRAIESADGR